MTNYKQPKRKFHDAWAFILFIIATIVANFIYFNSDTKSNLIKSLDYGIGALTALYFISFAAIGTILLITIPAYVMHAACVVLPVISVVFAFMSQGTMMIVLSIIFSVLSLLFYYFILRKNIKYSAVVCKHSSRIINKYMLTVPLILVSMSLIITQIIVASINMSSEYKSGYLLYLVCLLQMYWTFFALLYFIRVFVSSTVSLHCFIDENVSILSLQNTFFALGPICFGSLLVALVTTLQHLQRENQRESRGAGSQIFYIIISIILSLIRSIIEFANEWAYIYIGLYGTSYVEGVKGAYQLVIKGRNSMLINDLCLGKALGLISFAGTLMYAGLANYFAKTEEDLVNCIIFGICGAIFLMGYMSSFDSAGKALLFAYDCDKQAVSRKYPELDDALKAQMSKRGRI